MPTDRIVVVDTDIFSQLYITPEFAEKRGLPVAAWRAALVGARVVISFQTKAEVLVGIHGSSWSESRTLAALAELERFPTIRPIDRSSKRSPPCLLRAGGLAMRCTTRSTQLTGG